MPAQANLPTLLPTHSHPGKDPTPHPPPPTHPYLEWGHLMCSHSLRWASRFILRRGGQLGLLGHRTGL